MSAGKAVIGQSGGPTAVINRSLVGFIKEAVNHNFDEILGAKHGLAGMLGEDFVDLSNLSESQLYGIGKTPAAALGSVRQKPTDSDIEKLISIFEKQNIRNFLTRHQKFCIIYTEIEKKRAKVKNSLKFPPT